MIGHALMSHLQQRGKPTIGTTRRREILDNNHIYLDLSKNLEDWSCPQQASVAVICAGITKTNDCKKNPEQSSQINIQGVSSLVNNLIHGDFFVIYLSSNHVFDGSSPFRLPEDPTSPITEYGRQKAEAEKQISVFENSISIVLNFPSFVFHHILGI